jgi:hypothetical protein
MTRRVSPLLGFRISAGLPIPRLILVFVVICASWTTPSAAQRGTGADTVAVARSQTTLRSQPHDTSRIVARIASGARVRLLMCANGWCGATLGNTTGFVREDSLSAPVAQSTPPPTGKGYYNSKGEWVPSPQASPSGPPAGASARCRDGTYSFSRSRSGTCSHHGGVSQWL